MGNSNYFSCLASIISLLTTSEYKFLVTSTQQVADNEDILPITIKRASVHEELAGSPSIAFQNIEKRINKYLELMCSSPFDCFANMLKTPQSVVIMVLLNLIQILKLYSKR